MTKATQKEIVRRAQVVAEKLKYRIALQTKEETFSDIQWIADPLAESD